MPDWAFSINDTLFKFVTRGPAREHLQVFAPLGLIVGVFLAQWSSRLIARESNGTRRLKLPARLAIIVATAVLYPALVIAVIHGRCQWLTEGGSIDWAQWRMPFFFALIGLLIVATAIDFDQYLIPDEITITGMVFGVVWATLFAHMHLIPLWIDWNELHPITGPYIPEWIRNHPHWHGLLWSLAGLAIGAGVTWLARVVSRVVLGVEALGFGDVTLMGMIGSFLGWQPVLLVFLLAPICGLVIVLALKLIQARRAVPYGPYLSVAAVLVLFTWRWLWIPTRELFGHWPTLIALGSLMTLTLAALLGLVRLYRSIPVTRRAERAPPSTITAMTGAEPSISTNERHASPAEVAHEERSSDPPVADNEFPMDGRSDGTPHGADYESESSTD